MPLPPAPLPLRRERGARLERFPLASRAGEGVSGMVANQPLGSLFYELLFASDKAFGAAMGFVIGVLFRWGFHKVR